MIPTISFSGSQKTAPAEEFVMPQEVLETIMITDEQRKKNEELKDRLLKKREERNRKKEAEICELHDCKLVEGKINLHFGYPSLSDEYLNARINLFPNSKLILYGGCSPPVIDEETGESDIETETTVLYCVKCRAIEEEWSKTNSIDDFYA